MEIEEIKKNKFWAGAVLFNPQTRQMLMQKRDAFAPVAPHQWAFFGGVGETGESPKECAIREIQEELGISVSNLVSLHDYLPDGGTTWRYTFFVPLTLEKTQMVLGEGEGFDWVSYDTVLDLDLTPSTRKDVEFFLQSRLVD